MSNTNLKSDLKEIADHLPESATYTDAMYELYVRMKIAKGIEDIRKGRIIPHEEVKRRFTK